jgi:hypothetical protein
MPARPVFSTLNLSDDVGFPVKQKNDFRSNWRSECRSLSGRIRLSSHSLCAPSCAMPVVGSSRRIDADNAAARIPLSDA